MQKEIARNIGVSRATVCRWVGGTIRPDFASRVNLKRVYGIELDAWDIEWTPPATSRSA